MKNTHKRKNKLLALLLSAMMLSSMGAMFASCSDGEESSSSSTEKEETSSKTDEGIIKNSNFNFTTLSDTNVIGTTVTGWSRAVNSVSTGSAGSSKSASGVIDTADESWNYLTKRNYSDEAIKFALLQTNYRNDINITDTLFPEAETHLVGFYTFLAKAEQAQPSEAGLAEAKFIDEEFNDCMNNDFNTALALSNLFRYFKEMEKLLKTDVEKASAYAKQLRETYGLLGLFKKNATEFVTKYGKTESEEIPAEVKAVAEERWVARTARDWAKSDELRAKLTELGYAVKDSKEGYELTKL